MYLYVAFGENMLIFDLNLAKGAYRGIPFFIKKLCHIFARQIVSVVIITLIILKTRE